jgi:ABC-type glycerol-3-phosphate transport system permease component
MTRRVQWGANVAMIMLCVIMLFPVFATLILSFKRQADVLRKPPILFPCDTPTTTFDMSACRFSIEGYERIAQPKTDASRFLGVKFDGRILDTYLPNTVLYAFITSVLTTIIAAMAGYTFSRFQFRFNRQLQIFILALTGIPLLTNLIGLYQLTVGARKVARPLIENFVTMIGASSDSLKFVLDAQDRAFLILIYIGFFTPFCIWIVKTFFDAIPREIEEAALIDGCAPIDVLTRVIAPIAFPGLFSAMMLTFVGVWNEFLANYLVIGATKQHLRSVVVGIYELTGSNLINYQVLAAACVIAMTPVVILFFISRKTFFRAMLEGAVKG